MKIFYIILFLTHAFSLQAQVKKIAMPVINIKTIGEEMPTAKVVEAPEGCLGISITDNKYVAGQMVMTLQEDTLYDSKEYKKDESGIRIKIRGNSTGANLEQHPYKIKLSKKHDLLRRNDNSYNHKDWVLLSMYTWNVKMQYQQSQVLNIAGLLMSKMFDFGWVPEYEFVNLFLNGQYQGMYYLMESVERGNQRINISKKGFLIENDTFWWNENVYFKTTRQPYETAYTFKYPDDDDVTEDVLKNIRKFMEQFEDALYNNGDITKYMDMESFAKWILIHDLLGSYDNYGCNRFLYKDNLQDDSKLKMGPLWDYDSMFKSDVLSTIHSASFFYYPQLFQYPDFIDLYLKIWNKYKGVLKEKLHQEFQSIKERYSNVFDTSMKYHKTVFPREGKKPFAEQIDEVEEKIQQRIDNFESMLSKQGVTSIQTIQNDNIRKHNKLFDLQGRCINNHYKPNTIYIRNGKKYIMK